MTTRQGAWLFTRPGFETEGGQEWLDRAAGLGVHGYYKPQRGLGAACFEATTGARPAAALRSALPVDALVFTRDAFFELLRIEPLPPADRTGALLEALRTLGASRQWGELDVHVPAGIQDRDLGHFARKWTAPAARVLREHGWLAPARCGDAPRLDLILLDFRHLVIAESYPGQRARFPGGRPRLRLPREAPSRSTLKLEEAFLTLMDEAERSRLLKPEMRAVDLGAAPGGWSFQLARREMRVTAVDNGPMDTRLLEGGRVKHLRADGFTWLPGQPVDWMVCDIVDKPARTVDLAGRWFRGGHCRMSVFNLKLPMKQRLQEWYTCRERLEAALAATGRRYAIRAKQLYHDREEVTVMVLPRQAAARLPASPGS